MAGYFTEQCPATGQDVTVTYENGVLKAEPTYSGVHYKVEEWRACGGSEDMTQEKMDEWTKDTEAWCRNVSGRVRDVEQAREILVENGMSGYWNVYDIYEDEEE